MFSIISHWWTSKVFKDEQLLNRNGIFWKLKIKNSIYVVNTKTALLLVYRVFFSDLRVYLSQSLWITMYIWPILKIWTFWKSTRNQVSERPISLIPKDFRCWKIIKLKVFPLFSDTLYVLQRPSESKKTIV